MATFGAYKLPDKIGSFKFMSGRVMRYGKKLSNGNIRYIEYFYSPKTKKYSIKTILTNGSLFNEKKIKTKTLVKPFNSKDLEKVKEELIKTVKNYK